MINCIQGNAFELIKELNDYSQDIIFVDSPYSFTDRLIINEYSDKIIEKKAENKKDDKVLEKRSIFSKK